MISEIFPNAIRGTAMSLCVSALWIASFLLTFSFPSILAAFHPAGAFLLYCTVCLAGLGFVLRFVPETKNKTLEEIEGLWTP